MQKKDNLIPKIPQGGIDIRQEIENQKTVSFLKEYEALCLKYNRAFVPSIQLAMAPIQSMNIKKDDNPSSNNSPTSDK